MRLQGHCRAAWRRGPQGPAQPGMPTLAPVDGVRLSWHLGEGAHDIMVEAGFQNGVEEEAPTEESWTGKSFSLWGDTEEKARAVWPRHVPMWSLWGSECSPLRPGQEGTQELPAPGCFLSDLCLALSVSLCLLKIPVTKHWAAAKTSRDVSLESGRHWPRAAGWGGDGEGPAACPLRGCCLWAACPGSPPPHAACAPRSAHLSQARRPVAGAAAALSLVADALAWGGQLGRGLCWARWPGAFSGLEGAASGRGTHG